MQKTVIAVLLAALGLIIPTATQTEAAQPLTPNTAVSSATTTIVTAPPARTAADMQPVRVRIPAVGLDDSIQDMGVLANGALDVPNGNTKNVGWYAAGTVPGETGSAVFDAHVFAAFKNLRYVQPGDDIYVTDADGTVLHFVVRQSMVYTLSELTSTMLFGSDGQKRLNLITCAGKLTPDHSTYDHRLVVYTTLVE